MEYKEEEYPSQEFVNISQNDKITEFLLSKGIAQNEKQALSIILSSVAIMVILAGLVLFLNSSDDSRPLELYEGNNLPAEF